MGLKAGRITDNETTFAETMAYAMEQALQQQWLAAGRGSLSDAGLEDRRLMFVAIARGVLGYLKQKEAGDTHLFSTLQVSEGATDRTFTVKDLAWNVDDV